MKLCSAQLSSAPPRLAANARRHRCVEQYLSDESDESDESDWSDENPKKGVPEKKRKKLLDPKTWERDGRLIEVATKLGAALAKFKHNIPTDAQQGRHTPPLRQLTEWFPAP